MKSAADVFKMALFNEVKADAFYKKAADITQNDESRMLFLQLSQMEDDHARALIRKAAKAPCAMEFDPEQYLRELETTTNTTISEEENRVLEHGSMQEVLQLAIELENQAQDTYHSLAEKAVDRNVRDLCLELADVEEKHAIALQNLLNSLSMDSDDRPGL